MLAPRFLLAEDHGIVRLGTRLLIGQMYPDAVVKETITFLGTMKELALRDYDLLVLDIKIPGGDNLQMIDSIRARKPELPILVLSGYDEFIYAIHCIRRGANGYVHKEADQAEIRKAINDVLSGKIFTSEKIRRKLLLQDSNARQTGTSGPLTARETEIATLLVKGFSPSEIRNLLDIQLPTISTHKSRIFEKLGVRNVIELASKMESLQ